MDAHLLHATMPTLENIVGSRITKIYQYDTDIFVFALYGKGKRQFLTIRTGKNIPFLFLSDHHSARGENPPATVMRLRKHLKGHRIINIHCAWWERIIFFQVAQEESAPPLWFKIDLRKGVEVCFKQDENPILLYPEPAWLEFESIEELEELLNISQGQEKKFSPYLTPALRKTMQAIFQENKDKYEAFLEIKTLFMDLESGNGDIFLYKESSENNTKTELFAWQLPQSLKQNREEEIFDNVLFALNEFGKLTLFNAVSDEIKKNTAKPFVTEIKKLRKLKEKLDEDEKRLINMFNLKDIALQIQANLYSFDKESKEEEILINGEKYPLNPRLTIRENMENLFHQSLRGKRGLIFLETRKQEIEQALEKAKEDLQASVALANVPKNVAVTQNVNTKKEKNIKENTNSRPNKKEQKKLLPKQVLYRESSDGFTILLGKDVKGNGLVLKLASPHDYWLHTADGASAHAIIKRDHVAVLVPQETFDEAGRMVAEKSPFKFDDKALIQYALAKNIQPMRNAGAGMVRIVKSEGSFWV